MATPAFLGVHVLLAEDPLICEGSRLTLKTSVPHQPLPHFADDSTDAWRGAESCLRTHKALQATELKSTRGPVGPGSASQALLAAPLLPQGQRLLRLCEAGPQKEGTEAIFQQSLPCSRGVYPCMRGKAVSEGGGVPAWLLERAIWKGCPWE